MRRIFPLLVFVCVVMFSASSYSSIVGVEYSGNLTHVWISDGYKNDYYYDGSCLNTVSNFENSTWWENVKYGVSYGDSFGDVISNYVEGSPSGCSRVDVSDDVSFVNLSASKRLSILGKTIIYGKNAYIENNDSSIAETFSIKSLSAIPVTVWFVIHRDDINVGGVNETNYVSFMRRSDGVEVELVLNSSQLEVFSGAGFYPHLWLLDDYGNSITSSHLMPNSDWYFVVKDGDVYEVFRAGSFSSGQTKTLKTKWVDAGGDIGCVLQDFCEVGAMDWGSTGSSTNTQTNFNAEIDVLMTTSPGCSCTIYLKHKPATQYAVVPTSYPATYTNAVAKIISGDNPRTITGTQTVSWTTQCGGKDGSLFLQGVGAPATPITKTVTCNDVTSPLIEQRTPDNLSIFEQPLINLTCNATDETALRAIRVWDNRSGSYVARGNQTYTGLTYSASKTFNLDYTGFDNPSIGWYCEAEDTKSPTNDAFAGTKYFNYTVVIVDSCIYGGSGDWTISDHCDLDANVNTCPSRIIIEDGGWLNITGWYQINASNIIIQNPRDGSEPFRISSQYGLMYDNC